MERAFEPKWFSPRRGNAAVSWLLVNKSGRKARRVLTDAVCTELERLQRVLDEAQRSSYRFHFVQVKPGEDLAFAGPALRGGPENNQMQRTKPAPARKGGLRR
jgi:hypothetical protein